MKICISGSSQSYRTVPAARSNGRPALIVTVPRVQASLINSKGTFITKLRSDGEKYKNQRQRTRLAEDGGSCILRFERRRLSAGLEPAFDVL